MNLFTKKVALMGMAAILSLAFFNCSDDKNHGRFDYCVDDNLQICKKGPYETCTDIGPGFSLQNDCPDGYKGGESSSSVGGVSFESFSPRSISVKNNTSKRLVAFKGSPHPSTLISGIPVGASNHGLKKEGIFTQTGDFALTLITEETYNQYKNDLSSIPPTAIFAEIYCFYNDTGDNNNVFTISSKVGGAGRIVLNNPTNWNIEIRKDGPTGEILGYVGAQMLNTTLRLEVPEDYDLFPVFKRYNASEKEIYEVVPKYTSGDLEGRPYMKGFALNDATPQSWNFRDLEDMLNYNLSSGGFYLRVQNNSKTAVRFAKGDVDIVTSVGTKGILSSATNVYQIKIPQNPNNTYPKTQLIAKGVYRIGTTQIMRDLPEYTYKTDYIYTITVSGQDASNLTLSDITESDEPMDLESIFDPSISR